MKKKLALVILLIIVFVASSVVWYSPTLFKGYAPMTLRESASLARNFSQSGIWGDEDSQNIMLASSLVKEKAEISPAGNKFTPLFWSKIFNLTGVISYENLIFASIIISALALVFFTLAVYILFGFKAAAVFSGVYMLLPFNWYEIPYNFGFNEVAIFFVSLFFLFYFWGLNSKHKFKYTLIILAGFFLALAGMAKESFLVLAVAVFIYALFKKQKKILAYLFVSFFLVIAFLYLPDMLSGKNSYLKYFISEKESTTQNNFVEWGYYTHIFPDPYTYHYNKEVYLLEVKNTMNSKNTELLSEIGMAKVTYNMGVNQLGIFEKMKVGTTLLFRQLSRFLSLEEIGGPFIFALIFLGLVFLRKENKYLYNFFVWWVTFTLLFLSYILLGVRNHLADFNFAIALSVALGILFLSKILSQYFSFSKKQQFILLSGLSFVVFYGLVLTGHVMWGRIYDESHYLSTPAYAVAINKANIPTNEVIAVNVSQYEINKLNYLADKSMVIFAPQTLEKLINEEKLSDAFNLYNIKYIIGYTPELSAKIIEKTKVKNIADNNIDISLQKTSKTKSWLMNVIK